MKASTIAHGGKLLISVSLIVWLFHRGFSSGGIDNLAHVRALDFALAVLFYFAGIAILFLRWRLILGINSRIALNKLVPSYYIGVFSSNFLPGNIGGDFVRAAYLYNSGIPFDNLIVSSILDRIFGVVAAITIPVVTIFVFDMNNLNDAMPSAATLGALAVLGLVLITASVFSSQLMSTLESLFKNKRWAMIFRKIDDLFQNIKARPLRLLGVVGLSLISTFCIVMCYFYLARSMELELEVRTLSIVVPLSFFAASLPISIGGLGVRESAVIFLLSLFNVGTNQGVELNILYLLTLILVTAPGAIFLFCTPLSKRAETIEESQGS